MKFVCVKARPLYDARHVNRIYEMLRIHTTSPVKMTCLTDDPYGIDEAIEIVPLVHPELTGWWHKMQIFEWAQSQTESICYIDLDTIIVGNIDPLLSFDGEFALLYDFLNGKPNYQSSVMLMRAGFGRVLAEAFFTDTKTAMHTHSPEMATKPSKWGDQYFIERNYNGAAYLQDLYPGLFQSFKADIVERGEIPHGAGVICYHGLPRPFHYASAMTDAWRAS